MEAGHHRACCLRHKHPGAPGAVGERAAAAAAAAEPANATRRAAGLGPAVGAWQSFGVSVGGMGMRAGTAHARVMGGGVFAAVHVAPGPAGHAAWPRWVIGGLGACCGRGGRVRGGCGGGLLGVPGGGPARVSSKLDPAVGRARGAWSGRPRRGQQATGQPATP
jgi:hypothetical protein